MRWTYRHASRERRAFLADAKDRMGLASENMAYTAVDGVLQVFRCRRSASKTLDFASILPSVLRAIFLHQWDVTAPRLPLTDRATLLAEVRQVRHNHSLPPDTAIEATACTLRRCTNARDLDRVPARLPEGARAFWHVVVKDPAQLSQRIV